MAKKDEKDGKNGDAAAGQAPRRGSGQAPRRGSGQAAVEVEDAPREAPEGARDAQVTGPGGEPAVRIRVDEREMSSSYANAFRTNGTDEEVILDFGLNSTSPRRFRHHHQQHRLPHRLQQPHRLRAGDRGMGSRHAQHGQVVRHRPRPRRTVG